jgi:hypothetical protein
MFDCRLTGPLDNVFAISAPYAASLVGLSDSPNSMSRPLNFSLSTFPASCGFP